MMGRTRALMVALLGGASSLTLWSAAAAQAASDGVELTEVVVTATRRQESVQNVPMNVTPVTGQEVQQLKLFQFQDVQALSPGLSMQNSPATGPVVSLRGVGYNNFSSALPSVDTYINEVPVLPQVIFQSIYDVGQIEVLRGPQGTLRGRPAPAGAITLTSRRPSMSEYGGYFSATATDRGGYNVQAAANMPIVQDVLALRLAALHDENRGAGARNINSGLRESHKTDSVRATLEWRPTDTVNVVLTDQYLVSKDRGMQIVAGAGVGYNGPALTPFDRKAVQDGVNFRKNPINLATLDASWEVNEKNRLTFVGGLLNAPGLGRGYSDLDPGNAILGYTPLQQGSGTKVRQQTAEVRLESMGRNFWDYTVGAYYYHGVNNTSLIQPGAELPGAFGSPLTPGLPSGQPDPRYVLGVDIAIPTEGTNYAFFGNSVFHLPTHTDINVGARYLTEKDSRTQNITINPALLAQPIGVPCAFLPNPPFTGGSNYPGTCDLTVSQPPFSQPFSKTYHAWVYSAGVSQHFTPDIMAYFNFGHSWRGPGVTVGVTAPLPEALIFGRPETSNSYEVGIKADLFHHRLRVNADVFHQAFKGYIGRFENVPYRDASQANGVNPGGGFTFNADAVVDGAEVDVSGQITEHWTARVSASVADGHYKNASVPCRDTNFDGVPDNGGAPSSFPAGVGVVAFCKSSAGISDLPPFNATVQSEYVQPAFGERADWYLRGLFTYASSNKHINSAAGFKRDSYGLLDVFTGFRSHDGAWDLGLFARNIANEKTLLNPGSALTWQGLPTGYSGVELTRPQEFGVSFRYAFGGG